MVNREDCSMSGYVQWLRRQLLAARLYHPFWSFTVLHALGTFAVWAGAVACVSPSSNAVASMASWPSRSCR